MATAFNVAETKEHVLKAEAEAEKPTKWMIGRLPHRLYTHLQDKFAEWSVNNLGADAQGSVKFQTYGRNDEFVRFGVKGWTDFLDGNGNQIPFSTVSIATSVGNYPGLSDRTLEMMRPFIAELSREVAKFNDVEAEEKKA
jgi:hypothetical protein